MPPKYTSHKVEADYEIHRDDVHVATYDPITEDTTYTHGSDRYAGPIGKVVNGLKFDIPVVEEPDKAPEPEAQPQGDAKLLHKIETLKTHIASLEGEIQDLKSEIRGDKVVRISSRYEGIDRNPEGAPLRGPLGDTTPEFVDWARAGGMSKAHFLQLYKGRIKDLTYKGE